MPPHIRMVGPVGHIERGCVAIEKHRRHQGDIRQVGAAFERIIEHHHIAGGEIHGVQRRCHGKGHGPQMHGDMGGLGHHLSFSIEHRAGEIPSFLDIG